MRNISEILSPSPRRARRCYRRGSRFVLDVSPYRFRMDRNDRAKLLMLAEGLERASKKKGSRNGILGLCTVHLLRVLIFHCVGRDGTIAPSYAVLQRLTGFSRATIAAALARLEAAGLLARTRRLQRVRITRTSPITGLLETIVCTVQAASLLQPKLPAMIARNLCMIPSLWNAKQSSAGGMLSQQWVCKGELFGRPLRVATGVVG